MNYPGGSDDAPPMITRRQSIIVVRQDCAGVGEIGANSAMSACRAKASSKGGLLSASAATSITA